MVERRIDGQLQIRSFEYLRDIWGHEGASSDTRAINSNNDGFGHLRLRGSSFDHPAHGHSREVEQREAGREHLVTWSWMTPRLRAHEMDVLKLSLHFALST